MSQVEVQLLSEISNELTIIAALSSPRGEMLDWAREYRLAYNNNIIFKIHF